MALTEQSAGIRGLNMLRSFVEAARPVIYVQTTEETRLLRLCLQLAETMNLPKSSVHTWSATEGLVDQESLKASHQHDARALLDHIIAAKKAGIYILKDFHEPMQASSELRRRLRDAYAACDHPLRLIVLCSPVKYLPPEIEHDVAFFELPLPEREELDELLRERIRVLAEDGTEVNIVEEDLPLLARTLQGLTENEARHAIHLALSHSSTLDRSVIPFLQEEKRQLVRKTGLIDYIPDNVGLDQLGGMENLKKWLTHRKELFTSQEGLSAEIVPKGLLLTGVSGCGKSLCARVIADVFGLPLYRVEMSQIFSAGLGSAEKLFAEACRTMEEITPAVVWFDEIENGISREHQDASGVNDRIFAYFLTWMQEKPTGLFVAATANRIDVLPAELIRKGRFDQVFFIDLPETEERLEIFKIHFDRRRVDTQNLSLQLVAQRTEGWTGAEIEQCVIATITSARIAGKPVSDDYLFPALKEIVPLSKTMKEQVMHIRSWAFERAVRASPKK